MREPVLRSTDGRTFVPVNWPAEVMFVANERELRAALLAQALFTEPDFEVHSMCPTHGHEVVTLHEPMTVAHVLASRSRWTNPN